MKKFFLAVFGAVLLFLGLGVLTENIGAKFNSDEKALALIRQARMAIGGDAALAEIKGLSIKGSSTHTFDIDGVARTETGESEIVMQLSGVLARKMSIGDRQLAATGSVVEGIRWNSATEGATETITLSRSGEPSEARSETKIIVKRVDGSSEPADAVKTITMNGEPIEVRAKTVILNGKDGQALTIGQESTDVIVLNRDGENTVFAKRIDGGSAGEANIDGNVVKVRSIPGKAVRSNELARLALMLLLTPPKGLDVSYRYAGEGNIGGIDVNTIDADIDGSIIKLHLDRYSNFPVAINYSEAKMMAIAFKGSTDGEVASADVKTREFKMVGVSGDQNEDRQVRLSDFRSVNGVLLPYQWTTYVGETVIDSFAVASYEVNPAETPITRGTIKVIGREK